MSLYSLSRTATLMLCSAGLGLLVSGCATTIPDEHKYKPLIHGPAKSPYDAPTPPAYARTTNLQETARSTLVRANMPDTSIAMALSSTLPDFPVEIEDGFVDLRKRISISANNISLHTYLEYLSARTGYDFRLDERAAVPTIKIGSIAHRTWNLAGLSHNRKTVTTVGGTEDQGGGGAQANAQGGSTAGQSSSAKRSTEFTVTNEEDEWETTIAQIRAILQTDSEGSQASVSAVRSVGLIHAYGPPTLIRAADRWVKDLIESTGTQIHLAMTIHEVTLSDAKSAGISWNLLTDGIFNDGQGIIGTNINLDLPSVLSVAGAGALSIATTARLRDDSLSVLVNFLNQFGTVNLLTQPNITVSNGRSATLSSGEEFSFIESVVVNTSSQGTATITPVLSRILVGVEFSVTPRMRGDGKILLDVVPVVSSLQSFNEFTVGDSTFQTPRIALNELATQIVVSPGQTVHVGGLITDRIRETLNRLPVSERSILDRLFRAESNSVERRELVLTITARAA